MTITFETLTHSPLILACETNNIKAVKDLLTQRSLY